MEKEGIVDSPYSTDKVFTYSLEKKTDLIAELKEYYQLTQKNPELIIPKYILLFNY